MDRLGFILEFLLSAQVQKYIESDMLNHPLKSD